MDSFLTVEVPLSKRYPLKFLHLLICFILYGKIIVLLILVCLGLFHDDQRLLPSRNAPLPIDRAKLSPTDSNDPRFLQKHVSLSEIQPISHALHVFLYLPG